MTLTTIGGALGVFVLVAGILTTLVVYIRSGADKALIEGLKQNSEMQDKRVELQEATIADQAAKLGAQSAQIADLIEQVTMLRDVVTNKAEIKHLLSVATQLTAILNNHHTETMTALGLIKSEVEHHG